MLRGRERAKPTSPADDIADLVDRARLGIIAEASE